MRWSVAIAVLLSGMPLAAADPAGRHVKLAATLFGETVGEVQLSLVDRSATQLTYRSDLRVVRDHLRFRNQALIEVTFDPATGQLLRSRSRRCTSPEDGSTPPSCDAPRELARKPAAPALAAEILLARTPDGAQHCIDIVDEESGTGGKACAVAKTTEHGIELTGDKLQEPFRAVVADGLLVSLELPRQGAVFSRVTAPTQLSDSDLFAGPIPTTGDAVSALERGSLRLRVFGIPQALEMLNHVSAPGQTETITEDAQSLRIEVKAAPMPREKRARDMLDRAALLLAKARGGHVDCQAATAWFLKQARSRGWKATPTEGLAWVDGRFAFHQWAILETPAGDIPIDPLLAQVPADAGHVQLANPGDSAGPLVVSFQRSLSLEVE